MNAQLQAFNDNSATTLSYNGAAIRVNDDKLNLTDMWRAADSDPSRKPAEWLRSADAQKFCLFLADSLNVEISHLLEIGKGRTGTTAAHWQVGMAYAKYLSPEFHMWCNTVVRERMEGTTTSPTDIHQQLNDPTALRGLLLTYSEKVIALEHQIEEAKPKLDALDRIAQADGTMCITNAAKVLQMRPKDLFAWLAQNGWTYKRPGSATWLGYQSKTAQGLLEHKTTTVWRGDGSEKVTEQVRITAKGLTRLATIIKPAIAEVK
ncbi:MULTISPECIES: phage antirepressor KilAC domain-containing protein [Thalassospira]|uniref:phage antirepressor KilAC domain-containing protein n=1 Tax=Thalassospira TaxID=168934 RepID=UPI0008DD1780|nr:MULTISPECIES: phage antirepressor KilAC domain-containing protein [Thalassospira]MDM7975197.1 phage antirepressor KilAC domain-containing protein [Thalassospira xiamenensis]OHZ01017.1 hypothetical protein BC440_09270 [Thalassospira sp. MIT1004]PXX36241.1 phage antirepressor YoqD-like protein [Thalassospira sp. 11-3]